MYLYTSEQIPAINVGTCVLIKEALLKAQAIKLTLNDRWKPVTSVILFWTILLRLRAIFGWVCGGDSGFGIPICTSPKDESRSRESFRGLAVAFWTGALDIAQPPLHTTTWKIIFNNTLRFCTFAKIPLNVHAKHNAMIPRLRFVTCLVGYYSVRAASAPSFS